MSITDEYLAPDNVKFKKVSDIEYKMTAENDLGEVTIEEIDQKIVALTNELNKWQTIKTELGKLTVKKV